MGLFEKLSAYEVTPEGVLKSYKGRSPRVVLPGRVTSIGISAFSGRSDLNAVRCPEELRSIGQFAFQRCRQLAEAELGQSLGEIREKAFAECSALREISIPGSCRRIGDHAFQGCVSLQRVRLEEGIQWIGDGVFDGCTSLQEVIFPQSVQSVGAGALRQCTRLRRAVLPRHLSSLREQLFAECESLTEIVIPDDVDVIGEAAFAGCKALTAVHLPKRLLSLGGRAFAGCRSLRQITFPERLQWIGVQAFVDTALEEVILPEGVQRLEKGAFAGCMRLRKAVLPEGIALLGDEVFQDCTALRELNVPQGVAHIGDDCFTSTFWLAEQPGEMVIVGQGILVEYRGRALRLTLPPEVRIVLRHAFPADSGLEHLTITENVERMGWEFRPGLALTLCRNGYSVTVHYESSYAGAGRAEKRLREFWEMKRWRLRHNIFYQLFDPRYAFPLAVLMYLSEPEDLFYREYMERNLKDVMKHLITEEETENLCHLLQRGGVSPEMLDELIDFAIRHVAQGGSPEPQIRLIEHKKRSGGFMDLDMMFSSFDL